MKTLLIGIALAAVMATGAVAYAQEETTDGPSYGNTATVTPVPTATPAPDWQATIDGLQATITVLESMPTHTPTPAATVMPEPTATHTPTPTATATPESAPTSGAYGDCHTAVKAIGRAAAPVKQEADAMVRYQLPPLRPIQLKTHVNPNVWLLKDGEQSVSEWLGEAEADAADIIEDWVAHTSTLAGNIAWAVSECQVDLKLDAN